MPSDGQINNILIETAVDGWSSSFACASSSTTQRVGRFREKDEKRENLRFCFSSHSLIITVFMFL